MLKSLLSLLCLSGSVAMARSVIATVPAGSFSMLKTPKAQLGVGCSTGLKLTLDNATISGPVVFVSSFVNGNCEIYVAPNPRHVFVTKFGGDSCGTRIYSGRIEQFDTISEITIKDNRARLCEDALPGLIEFTETISDRMTGQKTTETFYSVDR